MAKTLSIRLVVKDDGSVALERAAKATDRLGNEADGTAASVRRLGDAQEGATSTMRRMLGVVGGLVGAGALAGLIRESYTYNQELESTKIGIAGLLSANREYLGTQDQWGAALGESADLLRQIQVEALKTKATVPQLGDAFATTFGAVTSSGLRATNDEILKMTTRLTQVGNAFGVPMEQMRQEINSLLGGMITEDSLIAKRLGFDNKSVKQMIANGKIVEEIIQRTDSYAKAAEAQSNTLAGKLLNTREIIAATFSEALDPVGEKLRGVLDDVFGWFDRSKESIVAWTRGVVGGIEVVISGTRDWITEHRALITDIAASLAVVGAAAGAYSVLGTALTIATSKVALTIAAVSLLAVTWDKLRHFGDIEMGGVPIASYLRVVVHFVGNTIAGVLLGLKQLLEGAFEIVKTLGTAIMQAVLLPIRMVSLFGHAVGQAFDIDFLKTIDGWIAKAQDTYKTLDQVRSSRAKGARANDDWASFFEVAGKDMKDAWNDRSTLSGVGSVVKGGLLDLRDYAKSLLPEFEKIGNEIAEKLRPSKNKAGARGAAGGTSDYDPKKFQGSIDKLGIGDAFNLELGSRGFRPDVVSKYVASAIDMQEKVESARLDVIEDAAEREYRQRLSGIEREYEEQVKAAEGNKDLIDQAERYRAEKIDAATDGFRRSTADQNRILAEQLVGTKEWARKMAGEIGTVPQQVTRLIGQSKMEIAGFFDDLFSGIAAGQMDLSKSLTSLTQGLARTWGRMLSDMLVKTINGTDSIITQLKELWASLDTPQMGDRMLAGAGMGGFVGGMFQKPGNQASLGGAIGGGIGAIWGPVGAAIGTALGTLIGSMIQKGKDSIKVAIVDGIATVTEKGISAQARQELETQVRRRVKDEMKAWQSILDLFPDSVKEQLAKLKKPSLNINGGVESADLTDEGALNALSEFLGQKLPAAAFGAYREGLTTALAAMGVHTGKITALFDYWGTLQGAELQDAVRGYVTTMLDAIDMRDKMAGPFSDRLAESRRLTGQTPLTRMADIDAQMASIVASASKLTDIEDVVAAQQRVTELARQRYDMEIAYLQRIDSIQKAIGESIASQTEQIRMAGMDDQGKVDYVWEQMNAIRGQLLSTVDPEEIQRLTQKLQGYVGQAFGLAPDNAENRDKLLAILDEVGAIADDRLESARNEVKAREEKALSLQEQMLEVLIGIRGAVKPGGQPGSQPGQPSDPEVPEGEKGRPTRIDQPVDRIPIGGNAEAVVNAINGSTRDEFQSLYARVLELRGARDVDPDAIAAAVERGVAKAMSGLDLAAETSIDGGAIDASGLFESFYGQTVLRIRDRRDTLTPRTGR